VKKATLFQTGLMNHYRPPFWSHGSLNQSFLTRLLKKESTTLKKCGLK